MVVFSVGHLFLKWEVIPIQFGKWVKYCGISYVFQIGYQFIQSLGMVYVKNQ